MAEAEVAMRRQRAHAEFGGEGESLAVIARGLLSVGGIAA
jgi:hypothetical protein